MRRVSINYVLYAYQDLRASSVASAERWVLAHRMQLGTTVSLGQHVSRNLCLCRDLGRAATYDISFQIARIRFLQLIQSDDVKVKKILSLCALYFTFWT